MTQGKVLLIGIDAACFEQGELPFLWETLSAHSHERIATLGTIIGAIVMLYLDISLG
jgi:hypothetical protein